MVDSLILGCAKGCAVGFPIITLVPIGIVIFGRQHVGVAVALSLVGVLGWALSWMLVPRLQREYDQKYPR